MGQSSRSLAYFNPYTPAWVAIPGAAGNPPIQGGDQYSQTTFASFQKKIYFANDGTPGVETVRPSKIYIDEDGSWTAKTVGLPKAYVAGNYTDESLLAKCILLANDLRARFIEHFTDAGNAAQYLAFPINGYNDDYIHMNRDKWALSYFSTQTFGDFPAPDTIPTPAPAATNEATLFTLVGALNAAFAHHIDDAKNLNRFVPSSLFTYNPLYHWTIRPLDATTSTSTINDELNVIPAGPNISPERIGTPDELEVAASMLDDLHQKYNWHRQAIWTHSKLNNPSYFDRYGTTIAKVGDIHIGNAAPTITPDFTDLFNYVNNLRDMYNQHVTNQLDSFYNMHNMQDNFNYGGLTIGSYGYQIPLAECTDLDSMFLLIFWLRQAFYMHAHDATNAYSFINITYTLTAGSPNLTSVVRTATGAAYTIPQYYWIKDSSAASGPYQQILNEGQTLSTGSYRTAQVLSSASGTAVLDRNSLVSGARAGQVANSRYHTYTATDDANGFAIGPSDATSNPGGENSTLVNLLATGTDIRSWLTLANEMYYAFVSHVLNGNFHLVPAGLAVEGSYTQLILNAPYQNFFVPAVSNFSYALFFSDTYKVEPNGIEYLVRGNPIFSDSTSCAVSYPIGYVLPNQTANEYPIAPEIITTRANELTNLPVLVNNLATNYDTDNVKLNIYRTSDGGNTWYLLDQVANGTTSYTDTTNDTIATAQSDELIAGETLYTTGGRVGDDQPPECKFIHGVNNTFYYGAILDAGQFFPNRILQSIQFAPDSAPLTFYDDLDDKLVGISSARSTVVAFCQASIYRMSGGFNELGQGALTHDSISDEVGGLNAKSIVQTEIGLFFAGTDGFYYTDGYQNIKVSLELDKTYAALTKGPSQRRAIYGTYDKATRTVWWACKESETSAENSVVFVFYLNYGVKPSGTFTTISNGLNFQPSSMVFKSGTFYFGSGQGYLLKIDDDRKSDLEINAEVAPSLWDTIYIPYDFTMVSIDLGTTYQRKYLTKAHVVGKNSGNAAITPYAIRDLNQTQQGAVPMAPINYTANCRWGNATFTWGDSTFKWIYSGKFDVWRRFPATTLRSDFMQVRLAPAEIAVYASSIDYPEFSYVVTNSVTKTATIQTPSGYTLITWPGDVVGYSLRLQYDDYTEEFEIVSMNAAKTILTLSDPDNLLLSAPSGTYWEIWGIKKNQRPTLTSITLHYAYLGDENEAYPGAFSNSGPGNAGGNPR